VELTVALLANPLAWIAAALGAVLVVAAARRLLFPAASPEARLARELAAPPRERPKAAPDELATKVFAKLVVELEAHGIDPTDPAAALLVAGAIEQRIDEYPLLDRAERAELAAAVRKLLG
jgi:hypothetical protein